MANNNDGPVPPARIHPSMVPVDSAVPKWELLPFDDSSVDSDPDFYARNRVALWMLGLDTWD